jgi:DNA-binding transcriptional regulator YdaS (Cro superfamily)
MENLPETALERAIRLSGGMSAMAAALGVTGHAVIYQWKKTRVPADRCPDVEQLTGVRCEDLRPDVNWAVVRGGSVESTKQGA